MGAGIESQRQKDSKLVQIADRAEVLKGRAANAWRAVWICRCSLSYWGSHGYCGVITLIVLAITVAHAISASRAEL